MAAPPWKSWRPPKDRTRVSRPQLPGVPGVRSGPGHRQDRARRRGLLLVLLGAVLRRAMQRIPVGGGAFYVLAGAAFHVPRLLFGDLTDAFGRDADDQAAGRELAVLRDDGAGGDDGARADLRAVEDRRSHPDQGPVSDLAAMHDGVVPDHAPLADHGRETGVGVEDATVLDVGAGADRHRLRVAAQHGPVPDARFFAETHLAYYVGPGRDPRGGRYLGGVVAVREEGARQIQRRTLPLYRRYSSPNLPSRWRSSRLTTPRSTRCRTTGSNNAAGSAFARAATPA